MEVDADGTLWFALNAQLTAFKPKGNVMMKSSTQ